MNSLHDILSNKDFSEPPEAAAIKKYVRDEFMADALVTVREREIVVAVPGAALANTLRLRSPALRKLCQSDKRLVIRIS